MKPLKFTTPQPLNKKTGTAVLALTLLITSSIIPKSVLGYTKSFNLPPAIYTSWSGPNAPISQMTGFDSQPTMSQVWTGPNTVNWNIYDNQINQAQTTSPESLWPQQPVSLVIPPQNLDVGGTGTASNPFNQLWAPSWAENLTTVIQTEHHYYKTWNYSALQPYSVWFVTEAGKRYNNNPKIGVVRLYLGFQGETQPLKDCQSYWGIAEGGCQDTSSTAALQAFTDQPNYCQNYKDYIYEVGKAAALAFPNKPVIAMAAPTGCANYNHQRWKRELFERWQAAGVSVGFSSNSFASDFSGAEGYQPNLDWAPWLTYNNLAGKSPLSTETNILTSWPTDRKQIQTYYGSLATQHFGATSFFSPKNVLNEAAGIFFEDWRSYASNNRASVILRDREFAGQSWDGTNGSSGLRGNFNIGAQQTNVGETPQACGGAYTPAQDFFNQITYPYKQQTCQLLLPTFTSSDNYAHLYNWQARLVNAGGKFSFQTTTPWASNAEQLRIVMASGKAGNVVVKTSGGQSQTIALPANTWRVETVNLTAPAQTVEIINNTTNNLYLHRVDWLRTNGLPGDNGGPSQDTPSPTPNPSCLTNRADINCDGKIDLLDLNILTSKL